MSLEEMREIVAAGPATVMMGADDALALLAKVAAAEARVTALLAENARLRTLMKEISDAHG